MLTGNICLTTILGPVQSSWKLTNQKQTIQEIFLSNNMRYSELPKSSIYFDSGTHLIFIQLVNTCLSTNDSYMCTYYASVRVYHALLFSLSSCLH